MTSHLTTYDAEGKILRVISCPPHLVSLQRLRPGEFLVKGRGDSITQKVVKGKIINKTQEEMSELRRRNPRLRFDTGE